MNQHTLEDYLPPLVDSPRAMAPASIDDRFRAFHARNPHVADELRRMALSLKAAGFTRYSIDALLHTLRWRSALQYGPDGEYRLNNNHASRYARLLMEQEPELAGFFHTRRLTAGDDLEGVA